MRRGSVTIWFDEAFLQDRWRPAPTGNVVELTVRQPFGFIELPFVDGFFGDARGHKPLRRAWRKKAPTWAVDALTLATGRQGAQEHDQAGPRELALTNKRLG